MGLYFRKSIGMGPFRVNFSKSGISTSVGVKGARVNVGPRGTYVTMSSNGIIYRQKLSPSQQTKSNFPQAPIFQEDLYQGEHTTTLADSATLTDTDSKNFIDELTKKAQMLSFVTYLGIYPLVLFIGLMFYISFENKEIISKPEKVWLAARAKDGGDIAFREGPSTKSKIFEYAFGSESFVVLDTTNTKWLKVQKDNLVGYLSRTQSSTYQGHMDKISHIEPVLINRNFNNEMGGGIVAFIILMIWLNTVDKKRLEMELNYEMDDINKYQYEKFSAYFSEATKSAKAWQYLHTRINSDYKRTGGAGEIIKRIPISRPLAHKAPLKFFKTNIKIPYIKLQNSEFFFLPERLLIKRGNGFAALFYKNLCVTVNGAQFIETGSVPGDATIISYTWLYKNKNEGPDRRFKNNRKIPVCLYSKYAFRSSTGLNEVIATSKKGALDNFAAFLNQVSQLQIKIQTMDDN